QREVKAKILAHHDGHRDSGGTEYRISLCVCPVCNRAILAGEEAVENDGEFAGLAPPDRMWPLPYEGGHGSPPVVTVSLMEAHKCLRAGAYLACAVMCGRTLEGLCNHFGTNKRNLIEGL